MKLRIGIIGCGGIATGKHLLALKDLGDLCEVTAFCDGFAERATAAAQTYGTKDARVYTDYHELLADPNVDVAYVLTPNISHSTIAVDAFHAGKHVMCEKPMAVNTVEAQKMMDAWKASGKHFSIGYQNRFRADVQHLYKSCRSGDLGEIYYAKAYAVRRRGVPTWGSFIQGSQQGGGPLIDIGTHSLDLALWLMDNYEVESVTGTVFHKLGRLPEAMDGNMWGDWDTGKYDVEDAAVGYIRMKNGALLTLESSWALNTLDVREAEVTLCGTKAGADLRNQSQVVYNRGTHGRLMEETFTPGSEPWDFFGARNDAPYLEAKEWLTSIIEDRDSIVKPEQAFVVTQILDAIYESARKNETVWFD
nr:Gfo/Idh/MocA family oxidoreductase [uncultured Marvinbryantia sp.]